MNTALVVALQACLEQKVPVHCQAIRGLIESKLVSVWTQRLRVHFTEEIVVETDGVPEFPQHNHRCENPGQCQRSDHRGHTVCVTMRSNQNKNSLFFVDLTAAQFGIFSYVHGLSVSPAPLVPFAMFSTEDFDNVCRDWQPIDQTTGPEERERTLHAGQNSLIASDPFTTEFYTLAFILVSETLARFELLL